MAQTFRKARIEKLLLRIEDIRKFQLDQFEKFRVKAGFDGYANYHEGYEEGLRTVMQMLENEFFKEKE